MKGYAKRISFFILILMISLIFLCKEYKERPVYKQPASIRILILSKYHLNEFSLNISSGYLFIHGKTISLDSETIKVALIGKNLHVKNRQFKELAEKIIINTDSEFEIEFKSGEGNKYRKYSGQLEISAAKNEVQIIQTVSTNAYVHGTALSEISTLISSGGNLTEPQKSELLYVMETVVRSYLLSELNRHIQENANVCDLTHCMHYAGDVSLDLKTGRPRILITEDNKMLISYFHSTCGGQLTGPEVYWPGHPISNYYRRGTDGKMFSEPFCNVSKHFKWKSKLEKRKLETIFSMSRIQSVVLEKISERVSAVNFHTDSKIIKIPIAKFISEVGKIEGWNAIKSNLFDIELSNNSVFFYGKGLGHGIGLCQYGASEMIRKGFTAEEVLQFYFNNAKTADITD